MTDADQIRYLAADATAILTRIDQAALQQGVETRRADLMYAGAHLDQAIVALQRAAGVDVAALDAQLLASLR